MDRAYFEEMRAAAAEVIARCSRETGAPTQCADPSVYATVAKLLRGEGDGDSARVEPRRATASGGGDVDARDHGTDQVAPPRGPSGLPCAEDRLPVLERGDRPCSTMTRQLGLKGSNRRSVLLLDRKKLGAA